jgi:hypothetical protein
MVLKEKKNEKMFLKVASKKWLGFGFGSDFP